MSLLPFHPYANIFPFLDEDSSNELVASIKQHGLLEPIVLFEGMVLDGRNRAWACDKAGVEPKTIDFEKEFAGKDPLTFAIERNFRRRHLDQSQRAMVAANLVRGEGFPANLREPTQAEAAKMFNVSERSVYVTNQVKEIASPALAAAVEKGDVPVSSAATAARALPKDEQDKLLTGDKKTTKKAVTAAGKNAKARNSPKAKTAPTTEDRKPSKQAAQEANREDLAITRAAEKIIDMIGISGVRFFFDALGKSAPLAVLDELRDRLKKADGKGKAA